MSPQSMRADAPSLPELQRAMAAHVLAAHDAPAPLDDLAAWLVAGPGVDLVERMAVYRNGYPARLGEALAEQFPAVAHLSGASRFAALVGRYLQAAGLGSPNLNAAGAELAAFLATDPLTAELPFLPDLAALEWRVVGAFHAADAPPLDAATIAESGLETLAAAPLHVQKWLAIVASRWPIHSLWAARETPPAQIDIDLGVGEQVLVRREGFAVCCEVIAADEAAALQRLADGATLGDLAESLAAAGIDPARVGAWFAGWMNLRLLAACETADG
ncbi:MAG: DNA-binding domain-containing protein [bacterium]